jgi:hypothetical protein
MRGYSISVLLGMSLLTTSAIGQNTFPSSGNVGIGTTSPAYSLDIAGGSINVQTSPGQYTLSQVDGVSSPISSAGIGGLFAGDLLLRSYWGVSVDLNNGSAGDSTSASYTRIPNTSSFTINSRTSPSAFQTLFAVRNSGNVGIGTTSPGAKLEVNGNMTLTAGSGASVTFADGTVQSTAWNGTLGGGDYAESVDVSGDHAQYEPGDVLVINPDVPGNFLKSTEAYSTGVAGIYSTKPGLRGRRQTTDRALMKNEVPMAMIGIVPTKVSAESGPIKPGDLLVTSTQPGYAMKGADRSHLSGAIVGKAMGNLASGTGVIEVLVSLQ